LEFDPPTCFPVPPTGQCLDDYVLQLKASTVLPPYTRSSGGRVRSYATTPPECPAQGYWASTVRFWWADGSVDSVVSKQPCERPPTSATQPLTQGKTGPSRRHRHRRLRRHQSRRSRNSPAS
jgi:hypothetical protein